LSKLRRPLNVIHGNARFTKFNRARGNSTTQTGLKVLCELDHKSYPKGIVVSDLEMASLNIKRADFHGEWNYTIAPSNQSREAVVS
jgi:hypothetical protein